MTGSAAPARVGPGRQLRRLLPLLALLALVALVLATGLHRHLSLETLREHRVLLLGLVERHAALAALAYVAAYAAAVALSVPGALVLTLAGGFLFGTWLGTALTVVGATLGATGIFLIARTALGETLRRRAGPWLARMQEGFKANALSYLLVLRLVPLFPFVVVNIVPALLGVPLRTYVLGTALGIVPGTWVYSSVGAGLGTIFDQGGAIGLGTVLTPTVIGALLGLAALALVPVAYKRWQRRRAG
jgi:uncharacterized membrane protein YdjX (TVP38/TMEM64 family)